MNVVGQHTHRPDTTLDGGSLDCGGGLLLLIRRAIDPLPPGGLLEILSTEPTVEVELPAWSRMTGNELVSWTNVGSRFSFLVSKGPMSSRTTDGHARNRNKPRCARSLTFQCQRPSLPRRQRPLLRLFP